VKNRIKLSFIILIFIGFNITTIGQQKWGVKVGGGISKITNSMEPSNGTITISYAPSGQGGLYYYLSLGKSSSLGAELLFSQIEGKEKLEMEIKTPEVMNFGHYSSLAFKHISYLSLPFYYGFTIKRLTINAGFQVAYALASSGREKNVLTIYGFPFNEIGSSNRKIDDINIKKWDFGPRAGITYPLTDRLELEATYYYGINNIQKGDPVLWESKVQQMTFGVRYTFWNK